MVAGAQNLRHSQPVPFVGPGILRIFQKAVPMALVGKADIVAEYAGNEARDGINNGHGRNFAAREHKIAH